VNLIEDPGMARRVEGIEGSMDAAALPTHSLPQ
jgi:hypothetical protein